LTIESDRFDSKKITEQHNQILKGTIMKPSVYLAGPITGLNYNDTITWREFVAADLKAVGINAFSPMRAKNYLANIKNLEMPTPNDDVYAALSPLSSSRGIMTRDRWDATRCDVLFVNFVGAEKVSIGTCMEIAWADLSRIPIVCVIESKGNPHEHGMIMESVGFRVTTLDEAIHIVKSLLL
jgi:hypothetical protein